ncbi:MAG: DUF411 domain-containing protein [Xanthobacteraceae bacterium]
MSFASRRSFLIGAASMAALASGAGMASAAPNVTVYHDPNCGCCGGWVAHMRKAGFQVQVIDTDDLAAIKTRFRIPSDLATCHTAEVEGYVIEGHIPAPAVQRLLAEKPAAAGLAVPGMPIGSPGMEAPGAANETYDVVLFGPWGKRSYARFEGPREL